MSRINTNVSSLIAQRVLGQNNIGLGKSLERLSTGLRINRGADDPAGLIASENLRAEKTALGAAITNAERAEQVVNIAEGGLQEVSSLLTELEGLITTSANSAGLSPEELEANQLQIDSILQTIDRVSEATSFQGSKLLNGNFGYNTTDVDAAIANFRVNGAKLNTGETRDVDVIVTQSAQRAGLFLSTGGNLDLGSAGDQFVLEITGSLGTRAVTFASGHTTAVITETINSFKDVTGVSATVSGTGFRIDSVAFGSDEVVTVKVLDDGGLSVVDPTTGIHTLAASNAGVASAAVTLFSNAGNGITDNGQDVGATINGVIATTRGTRASISTDFLSVELNLTDAAATALGAISAFTITGGGADFQLASQVDISGKVSLGIDNVSTSGIGRTTDDGAVFTLGDLAAGKSLNIVDGDRTIAQRAVRQAIKDISALRGRLGAFQKNTVGATIRSLGVSFENTTAAESAIRDADFAAETASLTRSQILVSSSTNVLAIANTQPQNILQLLG